PELPSSRPLTRVKFHYHSARQMEQDLGTRSGHLRSEAPLSVRGELLPAEGLHLSRVRDASPAFASKPNRTCAALDRCALALPLSWRRTESGTRPLFLHADPPFPVVRVFIELLTESFRHIAGMMRPHRLCRF